MPFTPELMRLAAEDPGRLPERLGAAVPEDWPGPDLHEALPFFVAQQAAQTGGPGEAWDCLIIHTADRTVIGDIGFKGGPDPQGVTEIGYSIIPAYRRRGLAYEAARAMIVWALQQPAVTRLVAQCLTDNEPSIRVLRKLGMRQVGLEGDLLQWALPPEAGRGHDESGIE